MGIVYEGFDPFIERIVAIKTIQKNLIDKKEAAEILSRFRREAQAAGRLTHPNIVSVYEYGEDGDVAFIAMEYITGIELKEHFDKTVRFQLDDSVRIMAQLLDALEFSHARGVVHRDIKPSNILITKDGQVKIADFGIAKIDSSELTQVGTVLGTPSYMSPEQFLGLAVDCRSDIYSAGVILYQFLTGERPFTGSNMTVIMHKVLNQASSPLHQFNPNLPESMQKVIDKAMAKRPEDRYQAAAEFMKALKVAAQSSVQTGKIPSTDTTMLNTRQSRQDDDIGLSSDFDFSATEFDLRLRETQREAELAAKGKAPDNTANGAFQEEKLEFRQFFVSHEIETPAEVAAVQAPAAPSLPTPPAVTFESSLLAGLAREASERTDSKNVALQESQARARRVDGALNRIVKFFQPFIKHVNAMEPTINRVYRFDARTTYTKLKWQNAIMDFRKQGIHDGAYMDYAVFSVNLCAPEPVLLKRPWGSLDTLKNELSHLRLHLMEEPDADKKKLKQEWLETQLAPDFPVQIKFQGDYNESSINVMSRNLEDFGVVAYKLVPDEATQAFLDSLGLFLIGRSNQLPAQLRRA